MPFDAFAGRRGAWRRAGRGADAGARDRLRFRAQPARASRRYLSGRGRGRRDQLQRRYLRLYPHRPSDRLARRRAGVRAWRLAPVPVRSQRQVRARDRPGHLRLHVCPAGAHRPAGQHLGRRPDDELCDQARSRRPGRDAARPQGGSGPDSGTAAAHPQAIAGGAPGAGEQTDLFDRPTDVAWDAAGNIYVADGLGNARVAKFNKNGVFIKSWGAKGNEQGNFGTARSIAIDARGNVYVGDGGNKRIEVFDTDGNFKTQFTNVGNPQALCITPGPNQFLYSSNSNPPNDIDVAGEIYKMRLDGSIMGKFGRAGKLPKEFGTVNAIDCRNENTLYVGEIGNMRVQKLTLK